MPVFWVAITFPLLLILQRWIHRHLRGVALLITGRMEWAVLLYAVILFPGVLLHEVSHWVTAKLLGVRTSSFSIIPQMQPDGSVQLGYVEYYRGRNLGAVREGIIGAAPLVTGTLAILLIGIYIFGVTDLAVAIRSGDIQQLTRALGDVFSAPDFLVWLYLIFAISNAMMPSESDRRSWPAFLLITGGILLVIAILNIFFDFQEALMSGLIAPLTTMLGYLGLAFSLAIGVDLVFMFFIGVLEQIISRLKGVEVVYEAVDSLPSESN
jgi:hypothetical protein